MNNELVFPKRVGRFALHYYPGLIVSLHRTSELDFCVMTTDACGLVLKSQDFTSISRSTAIVFMRDWLTTNYPKLN